jgi:hypothetical protein
MPLKWIVHICVLSLGLQSCGYIAEHTAPKKEPATTRTAAALEADKLFWATLHSGEYEQIQPAVEAETAAYLGEPRDAVSAAHVAWLHIWRLSERARLAVTPASTTDDAFVARRYFQEAVALNPREARYLGFLASATLADGQINQDEAITRRGYYLLLDAIDAWPEFNLFTAGYVLSGQPASSKNFKQALAWQWRNVDICIGEKINRDDPNLAPYMHLETRTGPKRACWNSWIAPHNFEGFFMSMGDMLVKAGDWQAARRIYANAKLSSTYSQWAFGAILDDRIRNAQQNVAAFNAPKSSANPDSPRMMADTAFSCVACHQE